MADEKAGVSLEDLISDLASSRADGIPVRKRNDLMQQASTCLQESSADRSLLANLSGA
jgi:hypothetical protein